MFFDEYGRPFIIVKEQAGPEKKHLKGTDATKVYIIFWESIFYYL